VVEHGEGGGGGVIVMGSAHLRPKTTAVSCGDCSEVRPTDLQPDTAGEETTMSAMSTIHQLLAMLQVGKDKCSTQGSQGHEHQRLQGEAGGHCGGGDGKRTNVGALKSMGGREVVELRGYKRTCSQGSKGMRESNRASFPSSWDGCGCEDDNFTGLTHDYCTTYAISRTGQGMPMAGQGMPMACLWHKSCNYAIGMPCPQLHDLCKACLAQYTHKHAPSPPTHTTHIHTAQSKLETRIWPSQTLETLSATITSLLPLTRSLARSLPLSRTRARTQHTNTHTQTHTHDKHTEHITHTHKLKFRGICTPSLFFTVTLFLSTHTHNHKI
jgi:hypothetical protein